MKSCPKGKAHESVFYTKITVKKHVGSVKRKAKEKENNALERQQKKREQEKKKNTKKLF
jgi:hypothetical protein